MTTSLPLIDIADLRRDSPSELRSELRGNLDNIILKALQKQPKQRYASVAEFRNDIERHFHGETVSAPLYFLESIRPGADKADNSKLVAVLPLTLMSPQSVENTDEAYLTVGLADAIITRLTTVRLRPNWEARMSGETPRRASLSICCFVSSSIGPMANGRPIAL